MVTSTLEKKRSEVVVMGCRLQKMNKKWGEQRAKEYQSITDQILKVKEKERASSEKYLKSHAGLLQYFVLFQLFSYLVQSSFIHLFNSFFQVLYLNLFISSEEPLVTYDSRFSCSSNQVAKVLLTLPYSSQLDGLCLSGIIFQIFYGLIGSWTAYLISVLYIEDRTRKEKENVSFKNHVIQWFEVLEGLFVLIGRT